jgi:O-Antigen ligase
MRARQMSGFNWSTVFAWVALVLLVSTLVFPYRFYHPFGPVNSFSIADIAIPIVLAMLVFALRPTGRFPRILVVPILMIGAFYLANLASALWAVNMRRAIRGLILLSENIALFAIGLTLITERVLVRAWKLYVAMGIAALAIAVIYRIWWPEFLFLYPPPGPEMAYSWQVRLGSPTWGASNLFAGELLLFIPIFFGLACLSPSRWSGLWLVLIAAASVVVFARTLSVGGTISLTVSGLAFVLLQKGRSDKGIWRQRSILALTLLIAGVEIGWFWRAAPTDVMGYVTRRTAPGNAPGQAVVETGSLNEDADVTTRLERAIDALAFARIHPFGAGVGNYVALFDNPDEGLIHNSYLQVLVEIGWIGLLTMLGLLLVFTWMNLRLLSLARGTWMEPYALGAVAGLAGFMFHMLGEPLFEATISGWLLWLLQGLVAGSWAVMAKETDVRSLSLAGLTVATQGNKGSH